ncbi:conserved hypothetical protein [Candidatus Zixiibacteriota bacterium]|nr:conserved hypothetical protein [candidate division Zixibacteria bacterium]
MVFVTTAVANWQPIFADPEVAEICLSQLKESAQHFGVSIVGYVLMPHHLHLLLGFPDIRKLSRFMQSFKILSSKKIGELLRMKGHLVGKENISLWQARFDDLIIVSEEQFRIKLNYIHENPVRAGLVQSATDYPYSSAGDWINEIEGRIKIDKEFGWTK